MDLTDMRRARHDYSSRKNMSREEITRMFNDFADTYDYDLIETKGYVSPVTLSQYLTNFYNPEVRSKVKVLDLAAGTGALGRELKKSGFLHVDALDPAEKMLEVARSENIYKQYFVEYIDGNKIKDISTDYYDVVTMTGALNTGLIPLKGFKEMIRIVKPGGCIVFADANRILEEGYDGQFFPFLSSLVKRGVLEEAELISLEDKNVSIAGSGPGKLFNYKVRGGQLPDEFWESWSK